VYKPTFGSHLPDSSVIVKGYQKLISDVNEKFDGRFDAVLSYSGQLGSQRDILEACNLGSIEFSIGEAGLLSSYLPIYGVFALPFLFDDAEHYRKCATGEPGIYLKKTLEAVTNLTPVGSASNGFRSVFLKKSINSLRDMKGLKIRTPESPMYVSTFSALGANPTPVPAAEMYSAIQTGVVDGMENVNETIVNYKIYEVVTNCTITKHIHNDQILMANKNFISSMAEDDQHLFLKLADENAQWISDQSQILDGNYRSELEVAGIKFNNVDILEFRNAARKPYDELIARDAYVKTLLEQIDALRIKS
jgi:tripartite ATP-independent transporter DctP family solute receptor